MTSPATQTIAIVRHGETDWNQARRIQGRTEVALNATGRLQAAATGRLLASQEVREQWGDWSALLSSPLARAVETASIVGSGIGLAEEPRVDDALLERDFGPAEGVPVHEAQERWPGLVIPGAESTEALAERSAAAFDRLLAEAPAAIVVAHGMMIREGLSRLTGIDVPRVLNGEVWVLQRRASSTLAPGALRLQRLGISHPAV